MNKKAHRANNAGSLTLEAALVLPLFMFIFYVFLFFIQAVYIQLQLDHAVRETAKEIAAKAYPLSFFQDIEDEVFQEPGAGAAGKTVNIVEKLLSGELQRSELKEIVTVLGKSAGSETAFLKAFAEQFYLLQGSGESRVVKTVMMKHLKPGVIKADKLVLCQVRLPQSNYGNLWPHEVEWPQYGKGDVIIQAAYELEIPLPLVKSRTVLLKNTAIERAWLFGGNGIYTDREEKGIFENSSDKQITVYVTRTGIKYHLSDCRYLRKSRIPMTLSEAKRTYGPCKICRPPR